MASTDVDDFTSRMFEAVNSMMLDMIAAIARKDYVDRRKRQAQGKFIRQSKKAATEGALRTKNAMLRLSKCWSLIKVGQAL